MPDSVIGEVAGQVVQGVAEVAADEVHRKFGWKGCVLVTAILVAIGLSLYFALR